MHWCLQIGTDQWLEYESQCPSGFHNKLKNGKTIEAAMKRTTKVGQSQLIVDTEFIYVRVTGIMVSSRHTIAIETLFSHEVAPHPTALSAESGEMRKGTNSVLKIKLQVLCGLPILHCQHPMVVFLDGCALWTFPWLVLPAKVLAFISNAVSSIM